MGAVHSRSFGRSFSISVLVHAMAIAAWLIILSRGPAVRPPMRTTWIEIETPSKRLKQDSARSHIVQTEAGRKVKDAAKDAFLGEHTQVVERETVSTETQMAKPGSQTQGAKSARTQEKSKAGKLALRQLGVGLPVLDGKPKSEDQEEPLQPGDDRLPGAVAKDYVKGFKSSDRTALNTKEFVFYGYFQRIRERLDRAWEKSLRDQLTKFFYRGRQLASDMDHTTRVLVTLNPAGEITRVQILEESGTRDLDDAAVKAFNHAGPFPNPPHGLVDAQGKIDIRWDFVLRT